ncbi:MAG: bifunctional proline dehydrogenase/L-glutamate gamma-semialdehyde dehydrogenase, partial [Oligoflexia bacterium]|nr:bifunctional proline dehydrogenase/L-glutamate gamma-semialdehyde dehydrogenase [Oligoflexia bacterium]
MLHFDLPKLFSQVFVVQTPNLGTAASTAASAGEESFSTFTLYYPEEYKQCLIAEGEEGSRVRPEIVTILNNLILSNFLRRTSFRCQQNLNTIPCTVAVFYSEREIVVFSLYLRRELLLLKEIRTLDGDNWRGIGTNLHLFKNKVEKVTSLPLKGFPCALESVILLSGLPQLWEDMQIDQLLGMIKKDLLRLNKYVAGYRTTVAERISDWILSLLVTYPSFRLHLLSFLSTFAKLYRTSDGIRGTDRQTDHQEVKRLFVEEMGVLAQDLRKEQNRSLLWFFWVQFVRWSVCFFPSPWFFALFHRGVRFFVKRFIAGESFAKTQETLDGLLSSGRDASVDLLGEEALTTKDADQYTEGVIALIQNFGQKFLQQLMGQEGQGKGSGSNTGSRNEAGLLRANVSVKLSALYPSARFVDVAFTAQRDNFFEDFVGEVAGRLKKILLTAKGHEVAINIDAESYDYRDYTFAVLKKVLRENPELHGYNDVGIAIQAYLKDAYWYFQEVLAFAIERGARMPVRLVKGAYWDSENRDAERCTNNTVVFLNKEETDLQYRLLVYLILDHPQHLQLCLASHNFCDHVLAENLREMLIRRETGARARVIPMIEHQCLHMSCASLSQGLAQMDWAVRDYLPIGDLLSGIGYLVRIILENSSQAGFLNILRRQHIYLGEGLLSGFKDNIFPWASLLEKRAQGKLRREKGEVTLSSEFSKVTPALTSVGMTLASKAIKEVEENKEIEEIKTIVAGSSWDESIRLLENAYHETRWGELRPIVRVSMLLAASERVLAYRARTSAGNYLDNVINLWNYYAAEEIKLHQRAGQRSEQLHPRGVVTIVDHAPSLLTLERALTIMAASLVAGNAVLWTYFVGDASGDASHDNSEYLHLLTDILKFLYQAGVPKTILVPHAILDAENLSLVFARSAVVFHLADQDVKVKALAHKVNGCNLVFTSFNERLIPSRTIFEGYGDQALRGSLLVTASADIDACVFTSLVHNRFRQRSSLPFFLIVVDESVKDFFIQRFREAYFNDSTLLELQSNGEMVWAKEEALRLGGKIWLDHPGAKHGAGAAPLLIELPYRQAIHNSKYLREMPLALSFTSQPASFPIYIVGYSQQNLQEAVFLLNALEKIGSISIYSESSEDRDYLLENLLVANIYFNRGPILFYRGKGLLTWEEESLVANCVGNFSGVDLQIRGNGLLRGLHVVEDFYSADLYRKDLESGDATIGATETVGRDEKIPKISDLLLDAKAGSSTIHRSAVYRSKIFIYTSSDDLRDPFADHLQSWDVVNKGIFSLIANYEDIYGGIHEDE